MPHSQYDFVAVQPFVSAQVDFNVSLFVTSFEAISPGSPSFDITGYQLIDTHTTLAEQQENAKLVFSHFRCFMNGVISCDTNLVIRSARNSFASDFFDVICRSFVTPLVG